MGCAFYMKLFLHIKNHRITCFLVVIVILILSIGLWGYRNNFFESTLTNEKHISYSFTISNTTNTAIKDINFYTWAPVAKNSSQQSKSLKSSHIYELINDQSGNKCLKFSLKNIPPLGDEIITIDAALLVSTRDIESVSEKTILSPESLKASDKDFEKKDFIASISKKLADPSPKITADNICRWLNTNISQIEYTPRERDIKTILMTKSGDCTEMMNLFIEIARASGLKIRGVAGYRCPRDMVIRPYEFHNWVEIYTGFRWVPVDPSQPDSFWKTKNHIAFKIIEKDKSRSIPVDFNRFYIEGDGISACMN